MATKTTDVFSSFLLKHFAPAKDFKSANSFLTTEELREQLAEMGVVKDGTELYSLLTSLEYVLDRVDGKGLCWLIV